MLKKNLAALTLAAISALACASSFAALKQGEKAPEFALQASLAGKAFSFNLKDALKKGPVVVYFYPSAYTGGCNIQAHSFATNAEKFASAGASIIGVSLDSIARLNEFSADPNYCAGKFPVASDADGKVAKAYQLNVTGLIANAKDSRGKVIDHGFTDRTTFVVTPDGKIFATLGDLAPDENVAKALETVQNMKHQK
ncbi:MAG: peroxiredoxin [Burkholderiaceae bacterium]|nr:peroxiredoxin [Burkholderiaceae bacterium]